MNFDKGQQQENFLNVLLALVAMGIFVASNFVLPVSFALILTAISLIAAIFLLHRESKYTFIPFCVLFFMLGFIRYQAVDNLPANDISNFAGESVRIIGTIREYPRIQLNSDDSYVVRYVVNAEKIKTAQGEQIISGGFYINAYYKDKSDIEAAQIGYKISAYGTVRKLLNYNNPGQLDVVTMLKSEGINASLSTSKTGIEIEEVEGNLLIKFLRIMAAVREHYKESMRQVMSNEDAAAIFAMLFGGYEGVNPDLVQSFVTTGIVHILSVSGSHMSLLAATVAWLCHYLKLNRRITLMIGLIVIGSYTVLSGFLFQVIRSAFMGFLVFFASSSDNYYKNSKRSLTLIAMFLLLYEPLALFHISFQLSFLATAGIIYWALSIRVFLNNRLKVPSFIAMSLATTIAASVFTQPIIAWYFNQLSISSLIANLIVIPIIEVVIIFGLFAGTIGLIVPFVAKIVFLFDSLIFGMAYELNKLIANLPASKIYFPTLNYFWSIFYYTILIIIIQKQINKKMLQATVLIFVAIMAFNIGIKFTRPPTVEVHFIDVHQGDSALVITPNGHAMMFDTGGVREHKYDIGARVDVPYLHHYGITKLDYIFLTHVHEDHAAGAGSIVKLVDVSNIITASEPKSEYATSMAISEQSPELNVMRAAIEGEVFDVDGVKVEVLYAPKFTGTTNGNEVSNVYKITFGNFSALFTGDLVKEHEAIILQRGIDVSSTVLKVGHHGSKTSSSKEFVESVNPNYAVFCVGANNTFGHPRSEVVALMEEVGAKIYRTDKNGAVVFTTDGNNVKVNCRL